MLDLSKAVELDGMDAIIPALKYQIVHVAWMHECPSKASVLFLFFSLEDSVPLQLVVLSLGSVISLLDYLVFLD